MTGIIKNTIVIIGLIALAAIGYYLFVTNQASELTRNESGLTPAEVQTRAFLDRLSELDSINLSGQIFTDDRFRSLQDYSKPVIPAAVGRVNPFRAPTGIGFDNSF